MTVGILLITHTDLGQSLLRSARAILAAEPARAEAIGVPGDSDPDAMFEQALAACRRLDSGDGVLVLTDLYGSTPSNIASRLTEHHNTLVQRIHIYALAARETFRGFGRLAVGIEGTLRGRSLDQ